MAEQFIDEVTNPFLILEKFTDQVDDYFKKGDRSFNFYVRKGGHYEPLAESIASQKALEFKEIDIKVHKLEAFPEDLKPGQLKDGRRVIFY